MLIIIILLLAITTIIVYSIQQCNLNIPNNSIKYTESFDNNNNNNNNNKYSMTTSFKEIEKSNALNNINAQLFDDITFRDVIIYDNDIDGRTGLDKCLDNKVGNCVEYGVSGVAYYYPPEKSNKYYGELFNPNKETSDKLVFPAF